MKVYEHGSETVKVSSRLEKNILYVFYEGPMVITTLQHIVEEANESDNYKELHVVFSSAGGDTTYINCFHSLGKKFGLKRVYAVGQTSSTALAILLQCKKHRVPVYIDPFCHVILHRVSTVWVGEDKSEKINNFNKKWVVRFEEMFDIVNEPLLSKLSKEEREAYINGDNIYLLGQDFIDMKIFKELKDGLI